MTLSDMNQLASDRGCVIKKFGFGDRSLYWVESPHFISKPFHQVDELVALLYQLPIYHDSSIQQSEPIRA